MAGEFGKFAVALSAGVTVDRGSLAQAERQISSGLGRAGRTAAGPSPLARAGMPRPAATGTPYAGRGAVAAGDVT